MMACGKGMGDELILEKSQLLQSNTVHSGIRGRSRSSREAARPPSRDYHDSFPGESNALCGI
jgi:hypothetical protein